ncbi:MAG: hypothetical protein V1838_05830 [Patescibacteria group bacterium]
MAEESKKNKRDVHGHAVYGDDASKKGLDYLDYQLSYQEARVFFEQARVRGKAQFEDHEHRNFDLVYNNDATYTVEKRRQSGGGWFGIF